MQKTYDEIRATYSCALPTEQELKDFFANLNMHLAIEDHQGPLNTQKNLVCYFTPFKGKFLNYVRCFNSFHQSLYGSSRRDAPVNDPKPHFGKRFPIYIILVGDRLNSGADIPYTWRTFSYNGSPKTEYEQVTVRTGADDQEYYNVDFRIQRNNRNITDSIYPMMHKDLRPATGSSRAPVTLKHFWPYYILLSETDARRGFSILKFNITNTYSDRLLLNRSKVNIPRWQKLHYLYALMECRLSTDNRDKIFAKSSNVLNIDDSAKSFSLSGRVDWYADNG